MSNNVEGKSKAPSTSKAKPVPKKRDPTIVVAKTFPTEPYIVAKDFIWRDRVGHEKVIRKTWDRMWSDAVIVTGPDKKIGRRNKKICSPDNKKFEIQDGSPNLTLPSCSKFNTFEKMEGIQFNKFQATDAKDKIRKIRFVQEQYGYYRNLKYLNEANAGCKYDLPLTLPSSKKIHKVKPLLC